MEKKSVRKVRKTSKRTLVRSGVGGTEKFDDKVGRRQGSALSPNVFDLIADVLKPEITQPTPWDVVHTGGLNLTDATREGVEQKLERWSIENFRLVERKWSIFFFSKQIIIISPIKVEKERQIDFLLCRGTI